MSADLLSPRPAKTAPITTADVRAALMRRYAAPEWALLFEVGDATGARLLSLFDLRDSTCRFPQWPDQERPPKPDVPAYCGAKVPVPGKTPYCERCAVRAYSPREDRRRLRI